MIVSSHTIQKETSVSYKRALEFQLMDQKKIKLTKKVLHLKIKQDTLKSRTNNLLKFRNFILNFHYKHFSPW